MKNLRNLQKELLLKANSAKILSTKEKQNIKAGQYSSKEECEDNCQAGSGGFGWGWGGSPAGCWVVSASPEVWDCMDS